MNAKRLHYWKACFRKNRQQGNSPNLQTQGQGQIPNRLLLKTTRPGQIKANGITGTAAAKLLESVKGTSNVAVKLGSIVLIKADTNGQEQTLIFDLTDKQRQNLEKNGFLLNQPQELLKYLNN